MKRGCCQGQCHSRQARAGAVLTTAGQVNDGSRLQRRIGICAFDLQAGQQRGSARVQVLNGWMAALHASHGQATSRKPPATLHSTLHASRCVAQQHHTGALRQARQAAVPAAKRKAALVQY